MDRIIISARGETRDWSNHTEAFVRALAAEMSLFQPVSIRIDKDDGTVVEYLYFDGKETIFIIDEDLQ